MSQTKPGTQITLAVGVQCGLPCIEGTRITTRAVMACFMDGVNVDELRTTFGRDLTTAQVEAAIRWELSEAGTAIRKALYPEDDEPNWGGGR